MSHAVMPADAAMIQPPLGMETGASRSSPMEPRVGPGARGYSGNSERHEDLVHPPGQVLLFVDHHSFALPWWTACIWMRALFSPKA